MASKFEFGEQLTQLVDKIVESYQSDERTRHIDRIYLPNREAIVEVLQTLLELVYPGYFGRQNLTQHNVRYHVGELLPRIGDMLFEQVHQALVLRQEEVQGQATPEKTPVRQEGPPPHASSSSSASRRSATCSRATCRLPTTGIPRRPTPTKSSFHTPACSR